MSGPAVADGLSRPAPGSGLPATVGPSRPRGRCLALHPVGFAVPATSPPPRCALTAPFHPYPAPESAGAFRLGDGLTGRLRCGAVCFLWHFPDPTPREVRGGGRYPPPWLGGARTFLPPPEGEERPSTDRPDNDYTTDARRWAGKVSRDAGDGGQEQKGRSSGKPTAPNGRALTRIVGLRPGSAVGCFLSLLPIPCISASRCRTYASTRAW